MKYKIIKSLLVALIVVPSVSLAAESNINNSLNQVSNAANKTAQVADDIHSATAPTTKAEQLKAQKYATDYAAGKIDKSTNGALSKTVKTSDNLNQTANDLKKSGKSISNLFS